MAICSTFFHRDSLGSMRVLRIQSYLLLTWMTLQTAEGLIGGVWKSRKLNPVAPAEATSSVAEVEVVSLESVTQTWKYVLDGAELESIRHHMEDNYRSEAALLHVASGKFNGQSVVGFASQDQSLFKESMVKVPSKMSSEHAARTLVHAWAAVHCVLPPLVTNIGGSQESAQATTKDWTVVVLGNNDHAQAATKALVALGCTVHVVSTKPPKIQGAVSHDAAEVEFCTKIGGFDAILDTVGNEKPTSSRESSRTLGLLQSAHDCSVYVSTKTAQHGVLMEEGILFGPNKARQHVEKLSCVSLTRCSPALGSTVQKLLDAGFAWPSGKTTSLPSGAKARGWTMGEFWESSTWPQNVEADTRFGFPTRQTSTAWLDAEDDSDILADRSEAVASYFSQQRKLSEEKENNPDVLYVKGVRGFNERVVESGLTGVVFLSAPFCRTCKTLMPKFQRMARLKRDSSLIFCKADASGEEGKKLSRHLGIEAVPSFILYSNGDRYGIPISLSKLPSKKLDTALEFLESGKEFDFKSIFGDEEEDRPQSRLL